MSFLYPLFLLAGATLVIPILIHLFNLRRYKTVYFPNTRFLKDVQLHSRKQSQVRYKWLLAARILFLIFAILAFAQPFLDRSRTKDDTNRLQVVYIDNSGSLSLKKGSVTLLERAKDAARKQVEQSAPGSRFLVITNDKPASYKPMPAEKALAVLGEIDFSPATKPASHIFSMVQGLVQTEGFPAADLYYFSDFQKNAFPAQPDTSQLHQVYFHGMPVRAEKAANVYIDTAYLTNPVLQTGQNNRLIVRTRQAGKMPAEDPVLQLSVNGQVKSAQGLSFSDGKEVSGEVERIDTMGFQVNGSGWQRIMLTVNDLAVRFDDTFRITARSAANLSVLVVNESQPNPFIQAAFRAYNGYRLDQKSTAEDADWKQYNLVILNGVTDLGGNLGKKMSQALAQGQSVCLFPGMTSDYARLNAGLQQIADIRITGLDSSSQMVSSLQQGADLVRDLFDRIPENVQLPTARWHYIIQAGLTANQQAILSFRNGDPFLAQYMPGRGRLYVAAAAADLSAGNFTGSYFFVPFLYQMTAQSNGGNSYALTAGSTQPVYIPMSNAQERSMVHLYGNGLDLIPAQRPSGAGLDLFLANSVHRADFYTLASSSGDSTAIAINQDRLESRLSYHEEGDLRSSWKGDRFTWTDLSKTGGPSAATASSSFPLWKVCVILALLMLAVETFMLTGSYRKPTAAIS
ncbi:MAG: hypothetical protein EOP49_14155 [Sphingobacteriales bacterium]|nr:MAG: hypothetical protein EOP49_14155 [Sphingobacteriales bacterium]